jgi:hypothetical protein
MLHSAMSAPSTLEGWDEAWVPAVPMQAASNTSVVVNAILVMD